MSEEIQKDDKVRARPKAAALALEGDTLRLAGNYARATVVLTQALGAPDLSDSLRAWVHAHLGASWLGLGNLELSVENLRLALQKRPEYAWARAHKGEAWRTYLVHNLAQLRKSNTLLPALAEALSDFAVASEICPNSPWIMAHYGATWTLAYFVSRHLPDVIVGEPGGVVNCGVEIQATQEQIDAIRMKLRNPDELAKEAVRYFDLAVQLNPSYSWALAFHAFLLVLRSSDGDPQYYQEALAKVGQTQLGDATKPLLVKTYFFKISSYLGHYDASVETAFQAQSEDPLNIYAPYFIAIGLRRIAEKHEAEGSPDAETWRKVAQSSARSALNFINSTQAVVQVMRAGLLDAAESKEKKAEQLLREVCDSLDVEAIALLERDPTLNAISQQLWRQQNLNQQAHC